MPRQRKRPVKRATTGSTLINANGGSRRWTKTVKEFCAVHTICWLQLPGCTIRSQTIDHYHPISTHPHLTEVPSNFRPACRHCNRARRNTPPHLIEKLRAQMMAMPRYAKQRNAKALRMFQ